MDDKNNTKEYRIFNYKLSLLIWLVCFGVVVWGFYKVTSLVNRRPDFWYFLFIVPFYLHVLTSLYFMFDRFRLVISPDGIKFQFWAYNIFSAWENIVNIEKGTFRNRLVLKNPSIEKWKYAWLVSWAISYDTKHIPFGRFTWGSFKELENDIKKHAPHLF